MSESNITRTQLVAFSLPMTSMFFMHGPVGGILPALYSKHFGLSLATIGTIMLVSRIFDAVTDPMIGYLSDSTKSPIGRRKPWIIAGSALSMLCVFFLFIPPEDPTAYYYGFWSILLYLAWTMSEIPYGAWGTEISRTYEGRSTTFTFRAWFRESGSLMFLATPIVLYYLGYTETTDITPDVLNVVAWVIMIALPITILIAVVYAPTGAEVSTTTRLTLTDILESLRINRPFRWFLPVYIIAGISVGMYGALSFIYMDSYLQIGDKFSYVHVVGLIGALSTYPVWLKVINKFGKHRSWSVSNILFGLGVMPIALITPGEGSFMPYLALYVFGSIIQGAGSIVPPSLLSDIIDYDILKTGTNRAGSYISLTTLLFKTNIAIGAALAFYILSMFGFDSAATEQTELATLGVNITALFIPGAGFAIAGVYVWFFPLNRRRASIVQRRIEQRAARLKPVA